MMVKGGRDAQSASVPISAEEPPDDLLLNPPVLLDRESSSFSFFHVFVSWLFVLLKSVLYLDEGSASVNTGIVHQRNAEKKKQRAVLCLLLLPKEALLRQSRQSSADGLDLRHLGDG